MNQPKSGTRLSVWRVFRFVAVVYIGVVALMGLFQRRYIYYPDTGEFPDLAKEAGRYGLTAWRSAGGAPIGWKPAEGGAGPRMVVFQGNAGQALHRVHYLDLLPETPGGERWDVYLFEYPGYGARGGRPSETVLTEAAVAAVEELIGAEPERPLYLLGESLGSGVAARVVAEYPEAIHGLLLLTPFTRLTDVAAVHFPFLPVRLLLRDRYDNVRHLRGYPGSVAVVLAENDSVVPARLGRELYGGFDGRKRLWQVGETDHNTVLDGAGREIWDEVSAFLLEPADAGGSPAGG